MDPQNPLTRLVYRERTAKPRKHGLTMIADWGLPPERQADLLRVAAPSVDLAKIAVGIGALLPLDVLQHKLADYRDHGITPFPGGQFLEHAALHDRTEDYLQAVGEAGFDCIEVSDNLLEIPLEQKRDLIVRARRDFGLRVLGEVGRKEGLPSATDLAEDAAMCLEAGAEIVFLEAADFFAGEIDEGGVQRIIDRCGPETLVFELPGPWIEGVTLSDVHRITRWLLHHFGSEANIANVSPDDVLKLEALRLGIGVNAGSE